MRPRIEALGEDALLLRLEPRIDPGLNARVHALAQRIAQAAPPWLGELVPGYASLAVCLRGDACGDGDADPLDLARDWLQALLEAPLPAALGTSAPLVEIPVCYDEIFAPDLDALAAHAGLSREEVVARHCAADYQVAMLGFAPGFPYLLGLDPALAMRRMATPRLRVPAGSVAIGGAQTGLYPRESPGGWQVIGRTPLVVFDPQANPPCLLSPGQRVRFVAIDAARFARLGTAAGA